MLQWLFRRAAPTPAPPVVETPILPGRVVYAIGDIHGRDDLVDALLDKIASDIDDSAADDPAVVFLGDYVDRGECSAEVLTRMGNLWRAPPVELHFLMGNHEAAMLDFADDPVAGAAWLRFGGLQTLHSFGVGGVTETADEARLKRAGAALRAALAEHDAFLRTALKTHARFGNVFCCHAAVTCDAPLDRQPEDVLLWGDPDFLRRGGPDDAWIVHGHTIVQEPQIGRNRIGVDTGAYSSGRLTAVRLQDNNLRFISTP